MELVLNNTDIFDNSLDTKCKDLFLKSLDKLNSDLAYKITVSFSVKLLNDQRFESVQLPTQTKKLKARDVGTELRKEKIYALLKIQLSKVESIINELNITTYSLSIQGDNLESDNIVKVTLIQDETKPVLNANNKRNKIMKVTAVVPSLPYIQNELSEFTSKRMNKIYDQIFGLIRSKKLRAEILDMKEDDDENELFQAFVRQYRGIAFNTDAEVKRIRDQLIARIESVLEEYR
ncbi:hypothetical protein M3194_15665 [Paenibacillus glycanilyticus]|uniref:hypothetical protein n=1 Tax=Paenibacillus glycanilyticus TaxID=126569 RepID=UPI00203A756A|nr:hypothetical protein [Paenibacillus glycanilyticus]MCM3628781.1 hypothetical protein [Paenibacillus glycanilyticus]